MAGSGVVKPHTMRAMSSKCTAILGTLALLLAACASGEPDVETTTPAAAVVEDDVAPDSSEAPASSAAPTSTVGETTTSTVGETTTSTVGETTTQAPATTVAETTTEAPTTTTAAPAGDFVNLVGGGQLDLNSIEGQDTVLWFWAPW